MMQQKFAVSYFSIPLLNYARLPVVAQCLRETLAAGELIFLVARASASADIVYHESHSPLILRGRRDRSQLELQFALAIIIAWILVFRKQLGRGENRSSRMVMKAESMMYAEARKEFHQSDRSSSRAAEKFTSQFAETVNCLPFRKGIAHSALRSLLVPQKFIIEKYFFPQVEWEYYQATNILPSSLRRLPLSESNINGRNLTASPANVAAEFKVEEINNLRERSRQSAKQKTNCWKIYNVVQLTHFRGLHRCFYDLKGSIKIQSSSWRNPVGGWFAFYGDNNLHFDFNWRQSDKL
jgi:hypothetical protein